MIARLSWRSIRARAGDHLAVVVVLLVGTTLLTGLAVVFETGLHDGGPDRGLLALMPLILGGWSVAIVVFGVVATVSLAVGRRVGEIALLRALAATPGQVCALVVESTLVAVPAVALGLLPGMTALVGATTGLALDDAGRHGIAMCDELLGSPEPDGVEQAVVEAGLGHDPVLLDLRAARGGSGPAAIRHATAYVRVDVLRGYDALYCLSHQQSADVVAGSR